MNRPGEPARHHVETAREAYRRQRQEAATSRRVSRATYAQLRAGIRDGTIGHAERLDEGDLVATYAANRNAIRRALQMLAADGLVDRRTRTGTMVTSAIVEFSATSVFPRGDVSDLQVEELDQDVVAMPAALAERMRTDAPNVLAFSQLGVVAGLPLYVRSGYVPQLDVDATFFEQVEEIDQDFPPMETTFLHLFGRELGSVESSVEWVPASESLAELLEIETGDPLLLREMVLVDADGRPRDLSFTYFRGDRVSLAHATTWGDTNPNLSPAVRSTSSVIPGPVPRDFSASEAWLSRRAGSP